MIIIDDSHSGIEIGKSIGAVTFHFRRDGNFDNSKADYKITDLREILKEM